MTALLFLWVSCSPETMDPAVPDSPVSTIPTDNTPSTGEPEDDNPTQGGGSGEPEYSSEITKYVDTSGEIAYIPAGFIVSDKNGEDKIATGLVVMGPDGSEFVWVPTKNTKLSTREFGSYFSGGSLSNYHDETDLPSYKAMEESVNKFGGFYMGRYEASYGSGTSLSDYRPASKPVTSSRPGRIWVQFSPQDATVACENMYPDNSTVKGFFPWGANWDTTLQWFIDSGAKSASEVNKDSTNWGNYSDDKFSPNANGAYTGVYPETRVNNIYDMAGNNWEWTQERCGSSYVMRGGGYNLMGGPCQGSRYPAAMRDPLPGNNHHPNVTFRVALYLVD